MRDGQKDLQFLSKFSSSIRPEKVFNFLTFLNVCNELGILVAFSVLFELLL